MTQVDFQEHWLFILRDIVQPIQQKIFTGYFNDVSCLFFCKIKNLSSFFYLLQPPKAALNLVVRYVPDRQSSLRSQHNESIYTVNLALNEAGKDYEVKNQRFFV